MNYHPMLGALLAVLISGELCADQVLTEFLPPAFNEITIHSQEKLLKNIEAWKKRRSPDEVKKKAMESVEATLKAQGGKLSDADPAVLETLKKVPEFQKLDKAYQEDAIVALNFSIKRQGANKEKLLEWEGPTQAKFQLRNQENEKEIAEAKGERETQGMQEQREHEDAALARDEERRARKKEGRAVEEDAEGAAPRGGMGDAEQQQSQISAQSGIQKISSAFSNALWYVAFDPVLIGFTTSQNVRVSFTGADAAHIIDAWNGKNWPALVKCLDKDVSLDQVTDRDVNQLVENFRRREMMINVTGNMKARCKSNDGSDRDVMYWIYPGYTLADLPPSIQTENKWDSDDGNASTYYLRYTPGFGRPNLVRLQSDKATEDRLMKWAAANPYHYRYEKYTDIPQVSEEYYFKNLLTEFGLKMKQEFEARRDVVTKAKLDGALTGAQYNSKITDLKRSICDAFEAELRTIQSNAVSQAHKAELALMNAQEPETTRDFPEFGMVIAGYTLGEELYKVRRRLLDKCHALGKPAMTTAIGQSIASSLLNEFGGEPYPFDGYRRNSWDFKTGLFIEKKTFEEVAGVTLEPVSEQSAIPVLRLEITNKQLIDNILIEKLQLCFAEGRLVEISLRGEQNVQPGEGLYPALKGKYGGKSNPHGFLVKNETGKTAVVIGSGGSADIYYVDYLAALNKAALQLNANERKKAGEGLKSAIDGL